MVISSAIVQLFIISADILPDRFRNTEVKRCSFDRDNLLDRQTVIVYRGIPLRIQSQQVIFNIAITLTARLK